MPIDHDRIRQNGWRQGSVFGVEDSRLLLQSNLARPQPTDIELPAQTRLVVASHSCDVVSPSQMEVTCELCPAIPLAEDETVDQFGYGRNPRRLRVPIQVDGRAILHEMFAPLRFHAERARLEEIVPDPLACLLADDLLTFEFWLAARFSRRVFPNAFDARLETRNHGRIRKALQAVDEHVHMLLYSLTPQRELVDEHEPYRIRVVVLAKSASMSDDKVMESLETVRDRIEEILQDRPGISAEVVLVGDEAMTYAQLRTFGRWGFEDLSLQSGVEPDERR